MTAGNFLDKHKPLIIYFVSLIISVTILTSEVNFYLKTFRSFIIYIFSISYVPITKIINYPITVSTRFTELAYLREENIKLKQTIQKMYLKNLAMEKKTKELDFIHKTQEIKTNFKYNEMLPVSVIYRNYFSWYNYLIISKGKNYNISEDLPVIMIEYPDKFYLVGRIWTIEENTSKVLLITNSLSGIPVKVKNKPIQGILLGKGNKNPIIEYIRAEDDVRIGDIITTSSVIENIPKGLIIGTVKSVEPSEFGFKRIVVELSFNINNLNNLIVILK